MYSDLPKKLYSRQQTREIDRLAIETAGIPGIVLMKRAGRAAFELLLKQWPHLETIVVLCGPGNNGGDGYVLAALAAQRSLKVEVYSLVDIESLVGDAKRACAFALQAGVAIHPAESFGATKLDSQSVIVDALLGTGFKGELRPNARGLCEKVNAMGCPVLALDIPSGLNGDSGFAAEASIKADATITFVAVKRGLCTGSGPARCGRLYFDDLSIPPEIYKSVVSACERVDEPLTLPPRAADAHKGNSGHLLLVGGDLGMGGATLLAAEAALRSGAGLVTLATRPEHVSASLARLPEVMAVGIQSGPELEKYLSRSDVVVLGPGLGRSAWSQQMAYFAQEFSGPMVVDADGLNLFAEKFKEYNTSQWVITPHPGEAGRLLQCSADAVQQDRFAAAEALASLCDGVVVLKGSGSLVAVQNSLKVATVGNPGMAVAGMGDVLSGLVGALLAQGMSLEEAALAGVLAHGSAGDRLVAQKGQIGLRASDLCEELRQVLNG